MSPVGTLTSSSAGSSTGDPCDCDPEECPVECLDPLVPEVGFVEIEPIDFTLPRTTSSPPPVRIAPARSSSTTPKVRSGSRPGSRARSDSRSTPSPRTR